MPAPVQPPLTPGAGPRPFRSTDDVLALLPALLRQTPIDPIRDALLNALTQLIFEVEVAGEYAAAQLDPVRATAVWLDAIGGDTGVFRAPDEAQEDYRTRLLGTPAVVTETAIVTAVNIILAPFTDVQCQFVDGTLDRWYVGQGSARVWHSFIGASPSYPTRMYQADAPLNGGVYRPNSAPGGARVFPDTHGRMFFLRVPDLSSLNSAQSNIFQRNLPAATVPPTTRSPAPTGFYVGAGVPTQTTYMSLGAIAIAVYKAIESTVNDIIGQSIRWVMIAEPGMV